MHLRVSIGLHLAPTDERETRSRDGTALIEFPRRYVPEHSEFATRWLCVHLTPRHALLLTDRRSSRDAPPYRGRSGTPGALEHSCNPHVRSPALVLLFRVFGFAGYRRRVTATTLRSYRIDLSSRVCCSMKYRRIGLTIPLCRWTYPRLCGFPSSSLARNVQRYW